MAKPFNFNDLLIGFSINQLAQLYNLDRRTVTERLREVDPNGERSGHPVYRMKDAAPLLCEGYVKHETLKEMAKAKGSAAEKDYWDARLKQQKYLENNGDLWRTSKVIDILGKVFKTVRENVVVFIDSLEHEADLPPKQIAKVKAFGDHLLTETREGLLQMDTGDDDQPGLVDESPEPEEDETTREMRELGLL